MAETERPSGVGPTQDGFGSLDLMRDFRTPSMSAIGEASEAVVFESFRRPEYGDRSQYEAKYGGSYTQAHDDPQEMQSEEDFYVQFDVVFVSKDKVIVTLGFVRCVNPDAGVDSPITDWEPTINGVPLSADDPPEIGVAAGQVLYCEVKTNNKGIVVETPRILVGVENETGTHYQPPQKSPQDGSLRYPIAKFEQSGDELVATQLQQGGPILVQPNLWEGRNVGGFREIYKERQNAGDYYEFRTLEQIMSDEAQEGLQPVAVLKPPPDNGEEDSIKVRFITQRPEEYEGEEKKEAQIKVIETDGRDGIIVQGNGVDADYTDPFGGQINIIDGLVASVTPADSEGSNYNVELLTVSLVVQGGGGIGAFVSSSPPKWYIRNGMHVDADDGAAVGTYRVISRLDNYGAVAGDTGDTGDTGETYVAP